MSTFPSVTFTSANAPTKGTVVVFCDKANALGAVASVIDKSDKEKGGVVSAAI